MESQDCCRMCLGQGIVPDGGFGKIRCPECFSLELEISMNDLETCFMCNGKGENEFKGNVRRCFGCGGKGVLDFRSSKL